jgi:hypothetical protein
MIAPNPNYPEAAPGTSAPGGVGPAEDFDARFARLELLALDVLEAHLLQGELAAVRVLLDVREDLYEDEPEPDEDADAPAGPIEVSWSDQS